MSQDTISNMHKEFEGEEVFPYVP